MNQLSLFVPDSVWETPSSLPDLRGVDVIAVDTETRDDGLAKGLGPGWAMGMGHVAGVSLAWGDNAVYLPWRHPDSDNLELKEYLTALFAQSDTRFVFHNAQYDLGWLGIAPPARIDDTAAMAAIVDENRFSYSLDSLCADYGLGGKDETLLNEAAASFGYKDVKSNMWRLPARYVGPYAEQDARATLYLYKALRSCIDKEKTHDAYQLEADLIPMIIEMRRRGIRVDTAQAERSIVEVEQKRDEVLRELSDKLAHTTDMSAIRSPQWLKKTFDKEGLSYSVTDKGNPSFEASWMKKADHWLPKLITRAKALDDMSSKFLQNYILDFAVNGRIHPSIHQFRSEGGGTRSHRFSYSAPPLQQAPSRDGEFAPMFRGLFLPEEGQVWGALDFSQQEYRLIVHYAELMKLPKAEEAGDKYRNDANTDFHNLVVEMTGLPRKRAKDTNFAKAYGAGAKQFAFMTGMTEEEAKQVMGQYDSMLPFVKRLSEECQKRASEVGAIRLLDGALCHFDLWESDRWDARGMAVDLEKGQAKIRDENDPWYRHNLRRAFTHKAANRLIQGSAARMTKITMRECWRAGLVPLLQMHDELDFSFECKEQALQAQEIMANAVKLTVPVKVDAEFGRNWAQASDGRTWEDAINGMDG